MEDLINSYVSWIRQGMTLQNLGNGWFELVTPFLNHKNDMIELYLRQDQNGIEISDKGVTINELALSGIDLERSKKKTEELNSILKSFGVFKNGKNEIFVKTDTRKFPEVKHRIIQAILTIDDMFMLSSPKVESFFLEDIETFFEVNNVIYWKDLTVNGKSGFSHKFDFSLPKIGNRREIAIKALNSPRKDLINGVLWSFEDTRNARPETDGLVIINDSNDLPPDVTQALEEYNIPFLPWSKRLNNLSRLRA